MVGGIYLSTWSGRLLLLLVTIPIAMVINAFRIFLTAFLMHFVDPDLGRGFMHTSEGWALFVGALGMVALVALVIRFAERGVRRLRHG
jgi:exosortase/archaeosortase family protein